jgi:hypothetical protein
MFGDPFLEYRANIRDTQIRVKSMVRDIPWRIGHGSEKFRLMMLDLEAQPHSSIPSVQTGLRTVL